MRKKYLEKGDVYFFYRNKMGKEKVEGLKDIARFYMVLVPDEDKKGRIFLVGRKKLPEISKGESKSTQRGWLMNVSYSKISSLKNDLGPIRYETKTKGEQEEEGAVPVGAGRYALVNREDGTELCYKLQTPEQPKEAQQELGILKEAGFIISAKNPTISAKGFPDEKPDYPKRLEKLFADKRWIDIDEPDLLNYENAQLLLIGAHKNLDEIEVNITGRADLYKKLELESEDWPAEALEGGHLITGEFRGRKARKPEGDRSLGGKRGGKKALKAPSAAGVASALKGIDLPQKKGELVSFAKDHDAQAEIIDILKKLPDRKFKTMADVQAALGEVS